MRTHVGKAKEETGKAPACTGAKLEIKRITRGEVKKADSEFVGCAQYLVQMTILEPKAAKGITVWDRIRVGTPDDKDAKKKETWEVSEGGPARLTRLLKRSGTAMADDDEEWMADAVGRTVVAPITHSGDFVNVGLYFRESDKDAPVIGLADGKGKVVKRKPVEADDEDEDEPTPPKKKKVEEDEEDEEEEDEEEEPAPKAKKKTKDADDEEEEDDEEEPAPKKAKKAKKPADDDEDDDD